MTDALAMRTGGLSTSGSSTSVSGQVGQSSTPTGSGGYTAAASGLGAWAATLQQASWRGLPFAVRSSLIRRGRRVAVHEYPFRDDVWVEDLGRGTRMVSFSAFLIGDDVFSQRDAMAAAAEQAGTGTLVHPSLGSMSASLLEFSAGERQDLGRVVEVEFSFIQTSDSQALYPTTAISTQATSIAAATSAVTAASTDFVSDVTSAVALGYSVVQGAVSTAVGFVAQVLGSASTLAFVAANIVDLPAAVVSQLLGAAGSILGMVNDAGITLGSVAGLVGNYGRYCSSGLTTSLPSTASVSSQLDALTANRATVETDMAAVMTGMLSDPLELPDTVATAISSFVDAVPSPADQLRLLATLAAYSPTVSTSTAPIGAAITTVQTAFAALVRRTACAALATATAGYQPTSYDEAMTQLSTVTTLLDDEALSAADAGDTASYLALRELRTAVADDLITRGAQLPSLITVTRAAPMPSLTLAYELYADATRSDDLIVRADPIHPLFMPTSFQALAR